MNGTDYVTKERLLQGAKKIEEVETPLGIVKIRPLTEAEKAKIESLGMKGITAKSKDGKMDGMELNMESILANDHESLVLLLSWGLSTDERYQPKEIKEATIDPAVRDLLVAKIREISGMGEGTSMIVDAFRQESRRQRTGNAPLIGNAVVPDGGDNSPPV
jgi:hypothetical protein